MKKVVYVNGYNLSESRSGVQRFMYNSLSAIDHILSQRAINDKFEIIVLVPKEIKSWSLKNIRLRVIKSGLKLIDDSHLWQQLLLPMFVRGKFLVNLCNLGPLFKKNQLVIIHDVIPFRSPTPSRKKWEIFFKTMMTVFMHRVKAIGTVSNFSKDELMEVTRVTREISVIGNSGGHLSQVSANPNTLTKFGLEPGKYFLSLSSQTEAAHKNFSKLLACNFKLKLVTIGDPIVTLNHNVIFTGKIEDDEIKSLYMNAAAFVFPSLYEGFGIPPLEAMECNCPVAVSDIKVLHEVCGDGAIYFDPNSTYEIEQALINLYTDEHLRKQQIINGQAQALKFNWNIIGERLLTLIEKSV